MNQLQYNAVQNSTGAFRAPRMRETHSLNQRTFGIVFAFAIEAAVIYLLLAQLGVVPMPRPQNPMLFYSVPLPEVDHNPPPLPVQPIEAPQIAPTIAPIFELEYVPAQENAITIPTPPDRQATLVPPPAVTFSPARALAATHTTPEYPPISRRLSEQGTLLLKLTITADGTVGEAVVEKSSGFPRLDAAAVQWVKGHWRYRPAMQGARSVASTASATVTFELH